MLSLLLAAAIQLPPIPPLPSASWPAAADAEPFARALMAQVQASELAKKLHDEPELMPPVLRNLGTALMTDERLAIYLVQVVRATPADDLARLAAVIMVDPLRYGEDPAFHARMNAIIPRILAALPPAEVHRVLRSLQAVDFEAIAPKQSIPFSNGLRIPDDSSPIKASIYSLNSNFLSAGEAQRFLEAIHKSAPRRKLIVLSDMHIAGARIIDSYSRSFTPWTRDPFIVAHDSRGLVFVNRPNTQEKRAEDQNMARAIVQQWAGARWTTAPVPFHNGNNLVMPLAVWISMHALETRVLSLLGLDRVPVATFDTPSGVARYMSVVEGAARELEKFYRRPVRFVHPMTTSPEMMRRLSGGAGIDLDSVLTIFPNGNALIGDLELGTSIARTADWSAVRREYRLKGAIPAQPPALQAYLDEIAAELQRDGMTVRRLPLLNIPASLVDQPGVPEGFQFLMTWNNVVLDRRRAEGFASLLPEGDDLARKTFAAAGYDLVLFPPLIRSIVLGGGYRCASNHVR